MKIYAYSLLYPAAANKTSLTDVPAYCIVGGASLTCAKTQTNYQRKRWIFGGVPNYLNKGSNAIQTYLYFGE